MARLPDAAAVYAEYMTHRRVSSPTRRTVSSQSRPARCRGPDVGWTAWQALVETADLQPGQRVLVVDAGGGGIGHLVVQIAKARARTASPRHVPSSTRW